MMSDPRVQAAVDPGIAQALAAEVGFSADEATAKQLLKQLLTRKNVVGSQRASVDAALAYWEMLPNAADEDVADGRQRMQEAADFYEKQPSEYSKEKLIWTYLSWANQKLLKRTRHSTLSRRILELS
ncbi:MAG TPA: hypothetical protein VG860_11410 [Terriglobia bacterium]|jgi:hypothetical protein|nr:hypothetical protein [Terriglobia bacterium]